MQQKIAMKFVEYVDWILLCKYGKFGGKIYYNSRDIEFFLGDYFLLVRPVHTYTSLMSFIYATLRT